MRESAVLKLVWLAVARTTVLFRIHTGKAWIQSAGAPKRLPNGDMLIPGGRPIALGFSYPNGEPVVGTHDPIGYTKIIITPAMVGSTLPVFTSIETKKTGGGKWSTEQITFCKNIADAGGISGFAAAPEDAITIIANWHDKFPSQ
jgi:hypothetical protein